MDKNEIKIDEIKRSLECCAAVGSETSCSDCSYCYRCRDLCKDALNIITEQEKEIDRLRAESKRFENNMKSVLEIEKKQAVKEFAENLKRKFSNYYKISGNYCCSVKAVNANDSDELLKEYEK